MSAFFNNKKFFARLLMSMVLLVLLIYTTTSVFIAFYVRNVDSSQGKPPALLDSQSALRDAQPSKSSNTKTAIKRSSEGLNFTLHDFKIDSDGTVDLTINLNVNQLVDLMNAYTDGSFHGEMTQNKFPPAISFLVSSKNVCEFAPNLQYLIYVHSAPENKAKRDILRTTWADTELFANGRTRVVFLLGHPQEKGEMQKLLAEQEYHHDLVIGDFEDAYRNLTLKAIMGLKWVSNFCPNVRFVIKADDDAFLNIFEIIKILEQEKSDKSIHCPLYKEHTMPIMRDPMKCKKWCVHFYEFPGKTHFPQYCAGLLAILSGSVVKEMYQVSHKTPMFWIDDVYLTGVLAHKVKDIKYTTLFDYFMVKGEDAYKNYMEDINKPVKYYISHIKKEQHFREMWNATLHRLQPPLIKQLGRKVLDSNPFLKKKLL